MAPELIRNCQCPESGSTYRPCRVGSCVQAMTGEDLLCDPCRWAEKNGGCVCHFSSQGEYEDARAARRPLGEEEPQRKLDPREYTGVTDDGTAGGWRLPSARIMRIPRLTQEEEA
jgi:hypothetical protein